MKGAHCDEAWRRQRCRGYYNMHHNGASFHDKHSLWLLWALLLLFRACPGAPGRGGDSMEGPQEETSAKLEAGVAKDLAGD